MYYIGSLKKNIEKYEKERAIIYNMITIKGGHFYFLLLSMYYASFYNVIVHIKLCSLLSHL